MLEYRNAAIADLSAVQKCLAELNSPRYVYSDAERISPAIRDRLVWVAVSDTGEIAGALHGEVVEGALMITALAVGEKWRRQGIGAKLVNLAETEARRRALPKIWCWSFARYHAHDFYRKAGFDESILLKRQFYDEDCWLFGKVL